MNLKRSLVVAVVLSLVAITGWELYLRATMQSHSWLADDKALWSVQRHKVNKLENEEVVLTGSSRVIFDVQLDVWEQKTGKRPVQLACQGSSPLPVFHDLVQNTDFAGTIIVGVTPPLFFSTTYPKADPWAWPQARIDHYHDRTYADRANHWLSIPLQKNFYFISAEEDDLSDNVDLKALLSRVRWGQRVPTPMPPFYQFGDIDLDRNVRMTKLAATDTAFANTIKKVWKFFTSDPDMPPPDRKGTTEFFVKDAKQFLERGGNLILLRCPSSGYFDELEKMATPRAEFWAKLVDTLGVRGYHYADYQQLSGYDCPEWSHLRAEDADQFTADLVDVLLTDGVIPTTKTN
jgi:hypothetical protein